MGGNWGIGSLVHRYTYILLHEVFIQSPAVKYLCHRGQKHCNDNAIRDWLHSETVVNQGIVSLLNLFHSPRPPGDDLDLTFFYINVVMMGDGGGCGGLVGSGVQWLILFGVFTMRSFLPGNYEKGPSFNQRSPIGVLEELNFPFYDELLFKVEMSE